MSGQHQIRLTTRDTKVERWEEKLKNLAQALQKEFSKQVASVDGTIVHLKAESVQDAKAFAEKIVRFLESPDGNKMTHKQLQIAEGRGRTGYSSTGRDRGDPNTGSRFSAFINFRF